MKKSLILIAVLLASACGGSGLKHTVPDDQLTVLNAEEKMKVEASKPAVPRIEAESKEAQSNVLTAQKELEEAKAQVATFDTAIKTAELAVETAKADAKKAEALIDYKKSLKDAELDGDKKDALGAEVDAAKEAHGKSKDVVTAKEDMLKAEKTKKESAKLLVDYKERVLKWREKQASEKDAEYWSAAARLEFQKKESIGISLADSSPDFLGELAKFQKQLADYDGKLAEARAETAEAGKGVESAKNDYESKSGQALPDLTTAPQAAPAPVAAPITEEVKTEVEETAETAVSDVEQAVEAAVAQ